MKKLSERAIEIMVERHKGMAGGNGYEHWHAIMSEEADYPSVSYVQPQDLAQALDEYQEQVRSRLDENEDRAKQAHARANEAVRLAERGLDPRLSGNWSDGRS